MLDLHPTPFDHPDAVRLTAEVQEFYRERYGDIDVSPMPPVDFAAPRGHFLVGYADGVAVACGGWRAVDVDADGVLREGDAEIKRMYVAAAHRGRGHARAVLAGLERTAVEAGRLRLVLETGTLQPEAVALYLSEGYAPMSGFGPYRCEPHSRCFAKLLPARRRRLQV
ncbi:MAG: GNAT family N-acetyltransferase [Pseudonocardia sp.]|nr:GNAT family N-acetyltransferase [Pseudonocardia sp.]